MNSSLWSADRITHIKIVAASLVMTAIAVLAIGSSVQLSAPSLDSTRNYIDPRPIVAGKPITLSATDSSTIC